jgi:site-specific DNA-methyltransferase (adenine-specific)
VDVNPYYSDDLVTIYHGDCREWMPEADAIVTDPPYGIHKAEWDDALPVDLLVLAAEHSQAMAIQPGVWNLGAMPELLGPQQYLWTLAAYLTNGMTHGRVGFGNWIPTMLYARPQLSLHKADGDAKTFIVGTEDKPDHPSPKPYRVMTWVIDRMPTGTVLDPFAGSGTTLVAAKSLGRKSIGIEIEEKYCEIAANRCRQEVLGLSA